MSHHAIVIGIDGYHRNDWKLGGAVRDALLFSRWLVTRGGVAPANLRLLLSPEGALELPPELAGCPDPQPADSETIWKTIGFLDSHPPDGAERLFFYYSGHGCSAPVEHFTERGPVLIPVDYREKYHFNLLVPISAILSMLAPVKGFTEQFFFLDACRDFVPEGMMPALLAGATQSMPLDEGPNQFSLYSTSLGQRAEERGRGVWTRHLLASLQGNHGALSPSPDGGKDNGPCYKVYFQPLARFVEEQIRDDFQQRYPHDWQQRVQVPQYRPGTRPYDPVLATFEPEEVAPLKVSILVDPRSVLTTCRLRVLEFRPGGLRFDPLHEFAPPVERPKVLDLPINHYRFEGDSGEYQGSTKPVYLTRSQTVALELKEVVRPAVPGSAPRVDPMTGMSEEQLRAALARVTETYSYGTKMPGSLSGGDESQEVAAAAVAALAVVAVRRGGRGRPKTSLTVQTADPAARVFLRDATQQPIENSSGREAAGVRETIFSDLSPGLYQVELHLPEGKAGEETVLLEEGESGKLTLAADPVAWPPHLEVLAERLGLDPVGYLRPSPLLGAIARPPLVSLLMFAAFAAHQPRAGRRSREPLRQALPVTPLPKGAAAGLLVLAGSAVAEPALGLAADRFIRHCRCLVLRSDAAGATAVVDRGVLRPVGDAELLGAAAEWQLPLERTGPLEVELRLPYFAAVRYAVTTLPGRLTVLAASVEEGGAVNVQQHVLPLPQAGGAPDTAGRSAAERLRLLDLAERLAARGDFLSVLDALDAPDLRNGEWLDPIAGALLGYALLRVGKTEGLASVPLFSALLEAFPDLPDAHVLAGLATPDEQDRHFATALATGGLPVFSDGLQALAGWASEPPPLLAEVLASGLIPGAAWSSWRAHQPLLSISDDRFEAPPPVWEALEERRSEVERTLRGVGRIELAGPKAFTPFVGTGFLVAPGVLMTASFVAEAFLRRLEKGPRRGTWTLREGVRACIDFREERAQTAPSVEVRITGVLAVDEKSHLALLTVEDAEGLPEPLTVGAIPDGEEPVGRPVYVVSYPMPDVRAGASPLARVFSDAPGTKRLQPGEILGASPEGDQLYHDCLTGPGSGGGPLVDLETGQVLGVHQSGLQTFYKSAVALSGVRDRWSQWIERRE